MGIYESELSKQIHLRNRQKREWELMKKKLMEAKEKDQNQIACQEEEEQERRREEDRMEIEETEVSKNLATAMLRSAANRNDDTLQRAVDLLQNQNGTRHSYHVFIHYALLNSFKGV